LERLEIMPSQSVTRRTGPANHLLVLVIALIGWSAALPAAAADDSPTIADSPRARITLADYEAELSKLPPDARPQFAANRARLVQLLNSLYLNRAVAADARAAGLDRAPVVARQIELLTEKLLAQAQFEKLDRETGAAFDANQDKYVARAREIYLTRPERFKSPEKVRVSHLLIVVGAGGDDAAKARAEELRAKVVGGAVLADLARQFSDDASAKRNAGDLGFFTASEVDPSFAAAAFALRTRGELSPVTKSSAGYHIIEFQERQPAVQRSFDDVKAELLAETRTALIESQRALYQGKMFTDPAPKVNEELIEKINAEARAASTPIDGSAKPAR
jgi:peptidyl-prolyl cis-trans isomerase C